MSTEVNDIISCPHCLVCSIKVTDHKDEDVAVCKVCGMEVKLSNVKDS